MCTIIQTSVLVIFCFSLPSPSELSESKFFEIFSFSTVSHSLSFTDLINWQCNLIRFQAPIRCHAIWADSKTQNIQFCDLKHIRACSLSFPLISFVSDSFRETFVIQYAWPTGRERETHNWPIGLQSSANQFRLCTLTFSSLLSCAICLSCVLQI